jgi:tripartite ATP-independent transporter DctP family solute receptor
MKEEQAMDLRRRLSAGALFVAAIATIVIGAACSQPAAPSAPAGGAQAPKAAEPTKAAAPAAAPASGQKQVLKLGDIVVDDHSYNMGAKKFADLVAQRTNGQVEVQIFPNTTLGQERDLGEGLGLGTIEMALVSTAVMQNFEPANGIFDLPYMFKNWDHVHKAQDSAAGQEAARRLLEKAGIRALAYYDQGFRHVLGVKKPIKSIDDFKGYKIRLPEAPVYVNTFQLLGATPTTIPWGEVYSAMQTKVVDGMEGSPETLYTTKLQEVSKYLSLTNHIYSGALLMISEKVNSKLTSEQQKIIKDAAAESQSYERQLVIERDNENLNLLKKAGIEVNELDIAPLQAKVKPMYEDYAKKIGGIDLITQAQNVK